MRRKSRELALQILFQREFASQISIAEFFSLLDEDLNLETKKYTEELVNGVEEKKSDIDLWIQTASAHWKMGRMSVVDRSILRAATFELRILGIEPKIVIDEAVEIAKKYGNTESGAFVNGVLDQVRKGS